MYSACWVLLWSRKGSSGEVMTRVHNEFFGKREKSMSGSPWNIFKTLQLRGARQNAIHRKTANKYHGSPWTDLVSIVYGNYIGRIYNRVKDRNIQDRNEVMMRSKEVFENSIMFCRKESPKRWLTTFILVVNLIGDYLELSTTSQKLKFRPSNSLVCTFWKIGFKSNVDGFNRIIGLAARRYTCR